MIRNKLSKEVRFMISYGVCFSLSPQDMVGHGHGTTVDDIIKNIEFPKTCLR